MPGERDASECDAKIFLDCATDKNAGTFVFSRGFFTGHDANPRVGPGTFENLMGLAGSVRVAGWVRRF